MSNKNETMNLALEVGIKRGDYETICSHIKDKQSVNQTIAALVNKFLTQYSQGGILLSSNDVDYLSKITGEEINDPAQIAEYIETATKRKGGSHTIEVSLDPAYWPVLEARGLEAGMTTDEVASDCVNLCFDSGWLYDPLPGRLVIGLTEKQRAEFVQITGKQNLVAEDVLSLIRNDRQAKAA